MEVNMKNLFKKSDFNFSDIPFAQSALDVAVNQANKKLNALIDSWPVVYSNLAPTQYGWLHHKIETHTRKARLAFIEPIIKEACKHEAEAFEFTVTTEGFLKHGAPNTFHRDKATTLVYGNKCKHCGVDLQATWTEKK
jgi:hypothetical protein